jgi:hypothetical protein
VIRNMKMNIRRKQVRKKTKSITIIENEMDRGETEDEEYI